MSEKAYCRSCNRDFFIDAETQTHFFELVDGKTHRHAKVDCDTYGSKI